MYREDQNAHLLQVREKSAIDKKELMEILNSLPIREKEICLVNLVTANRPNEMVRLRVRDFNLKNRSVYVYFKETKKVAY